MTDPLRCFLEGLATHERRVGRSINLTPSENQLSPLARIPFCLDLYSRYFLDDLRLFGSWAFHGGKEAGAIEQQILHPLLRSLARASHVNTRPISGLNAMTVALAALTERGETILTVPMEFGGHVSTRVVGQKLGLKVGNIPMNNPHDLDTEALAQRLAMDRPSLVYIDQSTQLFPIDPRPIRQAIDDAAPGVILYYDSSHANGLILGDALFNPLERGADVFGGSTHKTLPGPHKGFLATNDASLARRIEQTTDHLVSHHHSAEVASLTATLIEWNDCGGHEYAQTIISNARSFAAALAGAGIAVAWEERKFTGCHQVWVTPREKAPIAQVAARLEELGIIVNTFNGLPGIPYPSFRLSLAEVTRMGAHEAEVQELAAIFAETVLNPSPSDSLRRRCAALCEHLRRPKYCFELEDLLANGLPADMTVLATAFYERVGARMV